jgi:hypothetical protein
MSLGKSITRRPNLFLYDNKTPWRIREWNDRPGFSSFLVTFFFSFHKEKKKVTKRFEMKEKLKLKKYYFLVGKFLSH